MSDSTDVSAFKARSFQPVDEGSRVLIVTCPVLGDALLRAELGPEGVERYPWFQILTNLHANPEHGVFTGTAGGSGPMSEDGLVHRLNADKEARALFTTDERLSPFLETVGRRDARWELGEAGLLSQGLVGADLQAFAKDHPWALLTEASADELLAFAVASDPEAGEMAAVMGVLFTGLEKEGGDQESTDGEEAKLKERLEHAYEDEAAFDELLADVRKSPGQPDPLVLVFPDTPVDRDRLDAAFMAIIARLEAQAAKLAAAPRRAF